MKMKKVAAIAAAGVLAGAMSLTALAGCGGSEPATTPDTNEPSTPAISTAEDLVGKRIGVQTGTTGMFLAGDIEGATVDKYNKGVDAVMALKQGKCDAVMIDKEPAKVFVAQNDDLMLFEEDYAIENYAMAVAKGNEALRDEINGALKTLKENGTLAQIEANWIGDEAGQHPYESPADVTRDKGTLVMATNAEFPPYESMSGDGIVGYDVDMMQAVCDTLGYELKVENMEFDSVITAVVTGKAQVGVAGLTVTPDREKNVLFTESYATSKQVVIVKK